MKRLEAKRAGLAAGAAGSVALVGLLTLRPAGEEPVPPPTPVAAPSIAQPAPAPTPAPPPPPSAAGLRLYGLLGRGAVIASADGQQQFFALGREVSPGLRLARIEPQAAILASAGGELRLGFDGAAPVRAAAAGPVPAARTGEDALHDATLTYRLGLAPRRIGSRTAGFIVRRGISMPALEQAGLRPGDLILAVNGSGFDEERMLELAWEIANTPRTEFEIERGGRRMRLALQSPQ
jgi:general secretion pathway protein C